MALTKRFQSRDAERLVGDVIYGCNSVEPTTVVMHFSEPVMACGKACSFATGRGGPDGEGVTWLGEKLDTNPLSDGVMDLSQSTTAVLGGIPNEKLQYRAGDVCWQALV